MKLAPLLLFLLGLCPAALAGGLDPRQVPADARWVTHIDFEAMERSQFLRSLAEQGQDLTREFKLDRVQRTFGVDPCKDLTGLTFFNSSKSERDYAVIVAARSSSDAGWSRLVERARGVRRIGTRDVYGIGTDSSLLATSVNGSRTDLRLFAVATSEAGLIAALAVLDGDLPNLSAAVAPAITAKPSAGAIFFAAGSARSRGTPFLASALRLLDEFAALEGEEPGIVGRNAHGLVFELGEERGNLCTRLELEAPAAKEAAQVAQVLRTALARVTKLAAGTDAVPQIERLTSAVRIEVQGARVRSSFRYDAVGFVTDVTSSEAMMGVTKAR